MFIKITTNSNDTFLCFLQVPFAVGFLYVVFLGYMVREWRLLQFALVSDSQVPIKENQYKRTTRKVVFLGYMGHVWCLFQFPLVSGNQSRQTSIKEQQEKVVFLGYMMCEWHLLQFGKGLLIKADKYKRTRKSRLPGLHGTWMVFPSVRLSKWQPIKADKYKRTIRKDVSCATLCASGVFFSSPW